MLLYFIRHGDPIYEPDSLTPLGHRQAETLAKRLAVYGFDKIYSSTSNRAYLTALPTAEVLKKDIIQIDFFHEDKYAWEYFSVFDPERNDNYWAIETQKFRKLFVSKEVFELGYKWYEHPEFSQYKFKEGMEFFNPRIDEFMVTLGYEHDRENHTYRPIRPNNDRIAVFAHSGFSGVFLSSILDIPYPQFAVHHIMTHTGVTVIEFNDEADTIPNVLCYSNDSHLYRDGLPTRHCNVVQI